MKSFLCSERLPTWFDDDDSFRLIQELIESGGLSVLKRPSERYPEALRDRVIKEPLTTRREHLKRQC